MISVRSTATSLKKWVDTPPPVGGFKNTRITVQYMKLVIRNMQRTIRIQLQPEEEAIEVLTQTIEQYTWSFNAVCRLGWDSNITNGVALHKETYYNHRAITGLPSQLVCAARLKATEALKSANKLLKQKKSVSCPKSKYCPIRYDARSYTVWFAKREVTILAIGGRIKLKFELAEYYRQYLSWKNTSADLIRDRQKPGGCIL